MTSFEKDEPLWTGRRITLILFGIVLGVSLGSVLMTLPQSPLPERLRALTNPALREVVRGANALKIGDETAAHDAFTQAINKAQGKPGEEAAWELIVERCLDYDEWDLATGYAEQTLQRWPTALNQVRSGEALMGEGRRGDAERLFQKVLAGGEAPAGDSAAGTAYDRAELDMARALCIEGKDLRHAEELAEDLGRRIAGIESFRIMQAEMNDALACIHYREAATDPGSTELALARFYAETAATLLIGKTDLPLLARVQFHLAGIDRAQGLTDDAAEADEKAWRASPQVVHALKVENEREKNGEGR